MKWPCFIFLLFTVWGVAAESDAQAVPYDSYGLPFPDHQPYEELDDPSHWVRVSMAKLLAFLNNQKGNPDVGRRDASLMVFLAEDIAPFFDFYLMTKWVGGANLLEMNPARRMQFKQTVQQDFLATFADRLINYTEQAVHLVSIRHIKAEYCVVSIEIDNPKGFPAKLDFRLHRDRSGWKIFDVVANGSSAVLYYRGLLKDQIRNP
jgi:phospholipid transport system substrate-binding protein